MVRDLNDKVRQLENELNLMDTQHKRELEQLKQTP